MLFRDVFNKISDVICRFLDVRLFNVLLLFPPPPPPPPPAPDTLQIDINACVTAKEVGEVSSNNDEGKENVKESKTFLLIYSVLESE